MNKFELLFNVFIISTHIHLLICCKDSPISGEGETSFNQSYNECFELAWNFKRQVQYITETTRRFNFGRNVHGVIEAHNKLLRL